MPPKAELNFFLQKMPRLELKAGEEAGLVKRWKKGLTAEKLLMPLLLGQWQNLAKKKKTLSTFMVIIFLTFISNPCRLDIQANLNPVRDLNRCNVILVSHASCSSLCPYQHPSPNQSCSLIFNLPFGWIWVFFFISSDLKIKRKGKKDQKTQSPNLFVKVSSALA